jgi:uncharacterized protein YjbJ (UPF0337 family)
VKQATGEAVGNDRLANSGTADQVKGAAKEAWGHTKDAANAHSTATANDTRTGTTAHDVREKITSTAQNVKESVKNKADDFKHKRSA